MPLIEFIHELAKLGFCWINHQFLIDPTVAEGRRATEWLTHLGSDRNGGGYSRRDLLALPVRHRGQHVVKHAPSGRGSVYAFGNRYEVGIVLLEEIRKFQQFTIVARQSGELREDETGNSA